MLARIVDALSTGALVFIFYPLALALSPVVLPAHALLLVALGIKAAGGCAALAISPTWLLVASCSAIGFAVGYFRNDLGDMFFGGRTRGEDFAGLLIGLRILVAAGAFPVIYLAWLYLLITGDVTTTLWLWGGSLVLFAFNVPLASIA